MNKLQNILNQGIKLSNENYNKRIKAHLQLIKLGRLFDDTLKQLSYEKINIDFSKTIVKIIDQSGVYKIYSLNPVFYNATNEFKINGNITNYVVYDYGLNRYRGATIQDYKQLFKDINQQLNYDLIKG